MLADEMKVMVAVHRRTEKTMKPMLLSLALLSVGGLALPQPVQHRGIWMHATSAKTPAQADEILDRIQRAHLNAIYCLVFYWGGRAYYNSDMVARAQDIAPDFDPLQYLVQGAHARGIEFHAWFVNGENGSSEPGTVFAQHPDWMIVARNGQRQYWYDFGKPEVREFQRNVMLEVLRKYEVDGIHFDYIRYPSTDYCYCDYCRGEFQRKYGPLPTEVLGETFPLVARFSANPLARPTTAQTLAEFDHGVPAITLNALGAGACLLLNWHAEETRVPALDAVLRRALTRFGAKADNLYVYNPPTNRQRYSDGFLNTGFDWLKALGFSPQRLPQGKTLGDLKPTDIFVLTCVYLMAPEEAAAMEAFIRSGGHLIFIDGPVLAMQQEALQRVTGMAQAGAYFSEEHLISAVGTSELIPTGGGQADLARYRQALGKWSAFQKEGITALVRDVYQRGKQLKPAAQISAAVFYNRAAADSVAQNWYAWLDQGIVDYVIPMAYVMRDEDLSAALSEWRRADPTLERIIPGLSIYLREDGAVSRPPELVLGQTRLCLDAGARGTCFFAVNYLDDTLVEALAGGPYAELAQPYRPPPR